VQPVLLDLDDHHLGRRLGAARDGERTRERPGFGANL
jgi:hypothetical protein